MGKNIRKNNLEIFKNLVDEINNEYADKAHYLHKLYSEDKLNFRTGKRLLEGLKNSDKKVLKQYNKIVSKARFNLPANLKRSITLSNKQTEKSRRELNDNSETLKKLFKEVKTHRTKDIYQIDVLLFKIPDKQEIKESKRI